MGVRPSDIELGTSRTRAKSMARRFLSSSAGFTLGVVEAFSVPMKAFLSFVAAMILTSFAHAAKDGWLDDFEKAKAQAKAENKKILLDFTGSDWCGWCKKLDAEVFSQSEFRDYA